jgi:thioester reductase-like protein
LREALGLDLSIRDLFATPTVAALAAHATGTAVATVEPTEPTEPTELTADIELDADIRPRPTLPTARRTAPESVFLTGATGFVGAFLLAELLTTAPLEVHCLVRAADAAGGLERIRRQLAAWRLWRPGMESRIVPVPGDLARPRFGLSPDAFARLAGDVDAIYHCGAWVNFTYPYAALRASNVGGTREALRLAAAGRLKPVHHISTLAVLGAPAGPREAWREDDLPELPHGLVDGYAQSKWVAERVVHLARERGIPISIYRLGMVGGHSRTGVSNTRDLVWSWLKGIIQLGAATDSTIDLDLAPVDYVSRAIVHLSRQEALLGSTFHLHNPRPMPSAAVFEVIEALGYPLRRLPPADWKREMLDALTRDEGNALSPFLPLFEQQEQAGDISEEASYDDRNCRAGLAGSGIECSPVDPELLRTYLRFLAETGFLAPHPMAAPVLNESGKTSLRREPWPVARPSTA